MEQINNTTSVTEEDIRQDEPNQPSEAVNTEENTNLRKNQEANQIKRRNLLYEECLGFIPNSMKGRQDPRYVYAKFFKEYKDFDFTNEDFLNVIEEMGLLQQLRYYKFPNRIKVLTFSFEQKMPLISLSKTISKSEASPSLHKKGETYFASYDQRCSP